MNNLSEIKTKIVKYLSKKDINVDINANLNLEWKYSLHYSNFLVVLFVEKLEYEHDFYTISYHIQSGPGVRNSHRKRTKTSTANFCLNVYKILISFKKVFDEKSNEIKIETDLKNKYCLELKSYYLRFHDIVTIDVFNYSKNININITGYNASHKHEAYYSIIYTNNKYYLSYKTNYVKKSFDHLKIQRIELK